MTNDVTTFMQQLPNSCKQDANYKLYQQAKAAKQAIDEAIASDWESANSDKVTIVIDGKSYDVGLWSADVIGSLDQFLSAVQEHAVDELRYMANSK